MKLHCMAWVKAGIFGVILVAVLNGAAGEFLITDDNIGETTFHEWPSGEMLTQSQLPFVELTRELGSRSGFAVETTNADLPAVTRMAQRLLYGGDVRLTGEFHGQDTFNIAVSNCSALGLLATCCGKVDHLLGLGADGTVMIGYYKSGTAEFGEGVPQVVILDSRWGKRIEDIVPRKQASHRQEGVRRIEYTSVSQKKEVVTNAWTLSWWDKLPDDLTGVVREYAGSGWLRQEWHYVDGKRSGIERTFLPNGTVMMSCTYSNGVRHGSYAEWYQKKHQQKTEGQYHMGEMSGRWLMWEEGKPEHPVEMVFPNPKLEKQDSGPVRVAPSGSDRESRKQE